MPLTNGDHALAMERMQTDAAGLFVYPRVHRTQIEESAAGKCNKPIPADLRYCAYAEDFSIARVTEGVESVEKYVSDDLIDLLSVAGTPDEVRQKVDPLAKRFPHLLLHTAAESRDAFQAIVDTFRH